MYERLGTHADASPRATGGTRGSTSRAIRPEFRLPPWQEASPLRVSDCRSGRNAGVRGRAIGSRVAPASVEREQRDCRAGHHSFDAHVLRATGRSGTRSIPARDGLLKPLRRQDRVVNAISLSLSACGLLAGTRPAQPLQVAPREHRPTVGHSNDVVDHRGQRLAPAVTTARLLGDHGASPPLPARSVSPGSVRLLVPRLVVRPQAAGRLPVAWH